MSFPLGSFLTGKGEEEVAAGADDGVITGSIPSSSAKDSGQNPGMTEADWEHASAALREALGSANDDTSVPWQNKATGAQGTVTPIAASYIREGFACRNFLTSYVRAGQEAWFEGTACRIHRGQWDIQTRRPLQKS